MSALPEDDPPTMTGPRGDRRARGSSPTADDEDEITSAEPRVGASPAVDPAGEPDESDEEDRTVQQVAPTEPEDASGSGSDSRMTQARPDPRDGGGEPEDDDDFDPPEETITTQAPRHEAATAAVAAREGRPVPVSMPGEVDIRTAPDDELFEDTDVRTQAGPIAVSEAPTRRAAQKKGAAVAAPPATVPPTMASPAAAPAATSPSRLPPRPRPAAGRPASIASRAAPTPACRAIVVEDAGDEPPTRPGIEGADEPPTMPGIDGVDLSPSRAGGAAPTDGSVTTEAPVAPDDGADVSTAVMANGPLKRMVAANSAAPLTAPLAAPLAPPAAMPAAPAAPVLESSSASALSVARPAAMGDERASLGALGVVDGRGQGAPPTASGFGSDRPGYAPAALEAHGAFGPDVRVHHPEMAYPVGPYVAPPIEVGRAPRYGLLVAVVAFISIAVPITLYLVLTRGAEPPPAAEPSEPVSEIEKADEPRQKAARGKDGAQAPSASVAPSASTPPSSSPSAKSAPAPRHLPGKR